MIKRLFKVITIWELAALLITAFILYKVDFSIDYDSDFYFKKEDIYYEYQFAKQIQAKENPYDKILEGNMLDNDKYATQLPLYFYSLAVLRQYSLNNFSGFIENFRNILFCFHLLGGVFIYLFFRRNSKKFLGFSSALFYLFNVWSLNSFVYLKQDMIAIAFLLLSLYLFTNKKYRTFSYLIFGLSLGVKHIGIFVAPVYLTPLFFREDTLKKFAANILLLLATLILPTIPFLTTNPLSFWKSMLFSITRTPFSSEIVYGYSALLIKYNPAFNTGTLFEQILPRLPLLIASILCLVMLFSRKIQRTSYIFLAIMVFAIFNPVIFPQYITWVTPFALISLSDYIKGSS